MAVLAVVLSLALAVSPARGADSGVETVTYPATGEQATITRDAWGVPHIAAPSVLPAMYAIGVAQGEDKLWMLHVLRLAVTGNLAEFLGPIDTLPDTDHNIRRITYTESERARKYERLPEEVKAELQAFIAGVNTVIDRVTLDPTQLPGEFVHFGLLPIEHLTVDEVVAILDLVVQSSTDGGRGDLNQAALRQRLVAAHGEEDGRAMFEDLVRSTDPDAPVSIEPGFEWRDSPTMADPAADARRTLPDDARLTLASSPVGGLLGALRMPASPTDLAAAAANAAPGAPVPDVVLEEVEAVYDSLDRFVIRRLFGSNAQIVAAHLSATGGPLQTSGPQTDYAAQPLYWEFGVDVPGTWQAQGIAVPGFPYQAFGRSGHHAWTVTNGYSDVNDFYVEHLNPADPKQYLFDGAWEPMECRTEHYTTRGGVEYQAREICRTRHGPVISTSGTTAIAQRMAYWDREEEVLLGYRAMNRAADIREFATAIATMSGNWNVYYADAAGDIGYWHVGFHPQRAAGADIRMSRDGAGGDEWLGVLPFQQVPHVVNPERGWLVNWNNSPASDWPRNRADGVLHRVIALTQAYETGDATDPFGGLVHDPDEGGWTAADVWGNLRRAAYHDKFSGFIPVLPPRSRLSTDEAREAWDIARTWDGLAYDGDGDGRYDAPASPLMRSWANIAKAAIFDDDLGTDAGWALVDNVWHVLSEDSTAPMHFDWLNGEDPVTVATETFEQAVANLGPDPESYSRGVGTTRYAHLNAQIAGDLVDTAACPEPLDPQCLLGWREATGASESLPGYVPPHDFMNRGVYNHVVAFGPADGSVPVVACTVVTPGNISFWDVTGRTSAHYQDQRPLFMSWDLKPSAITPDEVAAAETGQLCQATRR